MFSVIKAFFASSVAILSHSALRHLLPLSILTQSVKCPQFAIYVHRRITRCIVHSSGLLESHFHKKINFAKHERLPNYLL